MIFSGDSILALTGNKWCYANGVEIKDLRLGEYEFPMGPPAPSPSMKHFFLKKKSRTQLFCKLPHLNCRSDAPSVPAEVRALPSHRSMKRTRFPVSVLAKEVTFSPSGELVEKGGGFRGISDAGGEDERPVNNPRYFGGLLGLLLPGAGKWTSKSYRSLPALVSCFPPDLSRVDLRNAGYGALADRRRSPAVDSCPWGTPTTTLCRAGHYLVPEQGTWQQW